MRGGFAFREGKCGGKGRGEEVERKGKGWDGTRKKLEGRRVRESEGNSAALTYLHDNNESQFCCHYVPELQSVSVLFVMAWRVAVVVISIQGERRRRKQHESSLSLSYSDFPPAVQRHEHQADWQL